MSTLVALLGGSDLGGLVLGLQGHTRLEIVGRMAVALGLTYLIGFERELRGAAAGDRTFALVGLGSAVIAYLALNDAPNALAGVVTGVGFLGAGVIIHSGSEAKASVRGVTTAACIYLAAAIGAAAGQGELLLATVCTVAALFLLELRHSSVLRWLDGRRWAERFVDDETMKEIPPRRGVIDDD